VKLHPKTAALVDRFAAALKEKLAAAEEKYGYSDGRDAGSDHRPMSARRLLQRDGLLRERMR